MGIGFRPDNTPREDMSKKERIVVQGFHNPDKKEVVKIEKTEEKAPINKDLLKNRYNEVEKELERIFNSGQDDNFDAQQHQKLIQEKKILEMKLGIESK
jgi:hypothetical protein